MMPRVAGPLQRFPKLTAFIRTLLSAGTSATALATLTAVGQGKHTIALPGAAVWARTTNGAAQESRELATNDIMVKGHAFDQTTEEAVQFYVPLPPSYNGGTFTAIHFWTTDEGGAAETVRFGISGRALANDDAMDQALGAEVTVDDTWIADNDLHVTAETAAITLAGSPAGGQLAVFQIARKVAADDLGGDAHWLGCLLFYTINAATDA